MSGSLHEVKTKKKYSKVIGRQKTLWCGNGIDICQRKWRKKCDKKVYSRIKKDSFDNVKVLLFGGAPFCDTLCEKFDVKAKLFRCRVQSEKFWQVKQ
jgi:hypothetical protein